MKEREVNYLVSELFRDNMNTFAYGTFSFNFDRDYKDMKIYDLESQYKDVFINGAF